ncbi:hypothetical protein [Mycolicibacterium palauense]|uniref:hypothetical protein n=1 Tax=Mycolicibacterium palauense TaxID=2034511 RepID=UPI000BFEF97E|nr:hypothetical protein [Mycolicibacterium palauense]
MSQPDILKYIRFAEENLEEVVLPNSYGDFHAKGLDYLCLYRSPGYTVKVYLFPDGMENQEYGEVVNPHDHRYDFHTRCLSGVIENQWYRIPPCWDGESEGDECGQMYNVFAWDTPLLGGDGFRYMDRVPLQRNEVRQFPKGQTYYMSAEEYHTIRVVEPETAILLVQYEDVIPVGLPTLTFTQSDKAPSIDGLYSGFTADQALDKLQLLKDLL